MKLHLHVKFRAFGRDIYNLDKSWTIRELFPKLLEVIPLDVLSLVLSSIEPQVLCNERGVLLELI